LMAMPAAAGLFHKVILQSGASTGNLLHLRRAPYPGVRSAEDVGAEFLSSLVPAAATSEQLRAIPAAAIVSRAEARGELNGYFLPVVDGLVIPKQIGAAFRDGEVPQVPMLAGYNADEGSLFYSGFKSPTVLRPGITGTMAEREKALAEVFGLNPAKALQALYGMDRLETWDRGATDMLGDDLFGVHMRYVGRLNAAAGQPTYLYHFTRVPPSKRQTIGAFHAAELSFVFNSHLRGMQINDGDKKLTQQMGSYWTNFARTGNPNDKGLPEWPQSGAERDLWLELDATPEPIEGLRARKLDILEEALRRRIDAVAGPKVVAPPPEPEPVAEPVAAKKPFVRKPAVAAAKPAEPASDAAPSVPLPVPEFTPAPQADPAPVLLPTETVLEPESGGQ
jgi:para-nitrobenzyl esterase